MSLLHSFYCWGHVGVVLLSTAFFWFFGISHWKILALMWAVIPIFNTFLFRSAPIYSLHEEGEQGLSLRELCTSKIFWMLMLMMTCAGASEQAVSQWASTFAETTFPKHSAILPVLLPLQPVWGLPGCFTENTETGSGWICS